MARKPGEAQALDKGRDERIDIAISEKGASVVTKRLYQLADQCQKLSPATARSLRAKALRLGINTTKLIEDVAVAVLERVVHTTPHDTGQARGNWQTRIRISRPESEPMFGEFDYDGDRTIAAGEALIRSTPRPDGHSIYISNSLPYISALNHGHSGQAPAGFVELAVQAGSQVASNAKLLKGS